MILRQRYAAELLVVGLSSGENAAFCRTCLNVVTHVTIDLRSGMGATGAQLKRFLNDAMF